MTEILLKAEKLKKVFTAGKKSFAAVDEVSFELKRGQCLGIVGESGSGKSTVARLITGLLPCTEGKVLFYPSSEGTEAGCIDISQAGIRQLKQAYRHMQMVFQMPAESFDPRRTLGDGIGESLRNMGIKGTELKTKVDNLLELCGLTPEFASRYPHQVSGEMCIRDRGTSADPAALDGNENTFALYETTETASPMAEQVFDLWKYGQSAYVPVSYTHLDVYKRQPMYLRWHRCACCMPAVRR